MANTFTNVIPQLLAQGLLVLRQQAIMARLVNRDYGTDARQKGDTIDVPIASEITARNVSPAVTWATNQSSAPTKVQIQLDQWKEASFYLTDKEMAEVVDGIMPMQASAAVKALANAVDSYILGKYKGIYSAGGTAGTTPFATNTGAFDTARRMLNQTLAPLEDRFVVLDPLAEANANALVQFREAHKRGDQDVIINGNIGHVLGCDWYLDQNIPQHTKGTLSPTTSVLTKAAYATGVTTVTLDRATLTGTLKTGDIFTLAGDTQQYVVAATATAAANAIAVTIQPALAKSVASNVAATIVANHRVNLVAHRDAFAFVSRPLAESQMAGLGVWSAATDPISGLSLRLEVARQYKQTTWSFDILYGAALVRPQLAARILG